ncbi:MAG TPA: hypothetical protein PKW24_02655 [Clostridiales bacterium]|nr:hypothetical protein [Clostridiales bacterium]
MKKEYKYLFIIGSVVLLNLILTSCFPKAPSDEIPTKKEEQSFSAETHSEGNVSKEDGTKTERPEQSESVTEGLSGDVKTTNKRPDDKNELTEEKTTKAVGTTNKKSEPDNTAYKEWSYKAVLTGDTVTYTENPNDEYIQAASKILNIPAQRLSATKNKKGATIFIFSSSEKSKDTLLDMRVMKPDKTIEEDIWEKGEIGNTKRLAEGLYDNAMKKNPNR